jgi:hypothetical protein
VTTTTATEDPIDDAADEKHLEEAAAGQAAPESHEALGILSKQVEDHVQSSPRSV